jgi:hypothetical protein
MRKYNFCRVRLVVVHRIKNFEHDVPQREELYKNLLVFSTRMCSLARQPASAYQYGD